MSRFGKQMTLARFVPFLVVVSVHVESVELAEARNKGEPLRIVVVGLDHGHAEGFLRRRDDRDDLRVVAIVEADREIAEDHAQRLNITKSLFFENLNDVLVEQKPDACVVFTNNAEHPQVIRACAERGVHVLVDKPLAATAEDANEIVQCVKQHPIHVVVDHGTTWTPAIHEIGKIAKEAKSLGEIVQIYAYVGHPGPKELGVKPHFMKWLADPSLGGGALLDMSNGAGWAVWLMDGMPETVTAVGTFAKKDKYPTVHSHNIVVLTYANGATAVLQASWNQPNFRKAMDVYMSRGYIKTTRRDTVVLGERLGKANGRVSETVRQLPPREPPYHDRIAHLIALIDGEIAEPFPLASVELNARAIEIMDAAQRSIDTGKTIHLGTR